MSDASIGDPNSWRDLAGQARAAAERLNDPAAWVCLIAIEEACNRFAQLAETRQRSMTWSRISRVSGGVGRGLFSRARLYDLIPPCQAPLRRGFSFSHGRGAIIGEGRRVRITLQRSEARPCWDAG
jgi:hypothetical protein